jgi:hypothetical protein
MKEKTINLLAISMALLSLIVSVAAFIIPYREQKHQFEIIQSEILTVKLNPHIDGDLRITDINLGQMGRVIQFPVGLTISNTGNQKLSIINYDVWVNSSMGLTKYSEINGGIEDTKNTRVILPIVLEPGESKIFTLYVGIIIPPEASKLVTPINNEIYTNINKALVILAKAGIDFYGNNVDYQEYPEGGHTLSVTPENQKSPIIWFQAFTGRGNTYLSSGSWYSIPDYK